jgi:hypothetical protein
METGVPFVDVALPGVYRLSNLANLIEFQVIIDGARRMSLAAPRRSYVSSSPCTARMFPAGSLNQAMPPFGPVRSIPFSSCSNPS